MTRPKTSEEFDGSCAWYQGFDYGYQTSDYKGAKGRARAVLMIQLDS